MPRRVSTAETEPLDTGNVVQFRPVARMKNPAAVALGKLGGSKGGYARVAKLSPEVRKAIAQQAAKARWAKGSELK
jgi:hypothetical protein